MLSHVSHANGDFKAIAPSIPKEQYYKEECSFDVDYIKVYKEVK